MFALQFTCCTPACVMLRALHYVPACCSVLQCVAVCCSVLHDYMCMLRLDGGAVRFSSCAPSSMFLQCVAVCCSVLQCVAAVHHQGCCSTLQSVAACNTLQSSAVCCRIWQCVAVCCSVLQCVAACCSMLQCVAVRLTCGTTTASPLTSRE